jgi:uncharacterized membrane protein
MSNPKGLPLGEAIAFGWRTVRAYPVFVVGTGLVAIAVPALIEWAGSVAFHEGPQQLGLFLIGVAVSSTLNLGLFKIYLRFRDGETPIFENLFDGLAHIHKYIAAALIAGMAIMMGLILLLVPGIVFLARLWFIGFVIVDERVGPLDAIQQSWDISRGYTFDLILLFILFCGINLLGVICLGVGVFVSFPVSGLALAHIYRVLKPRAAAAVPA